MRGNLVAVCAGADPSHPVIAVCVPCPAHGGFCLTLRWVLRFAYGYLKGGSDAGISHVEQASPPLPSGSDCCCIQRVRRPAARRALRGRGCRHCCAALLCGGLHADIVADGGASLNSAQQQLVLMNGMIFGELGVLIGLTEKFATVSGKTQRVSERENICAHSTVGEPR